MRHQRIPHLTVRSGIHYFRKVIPRDLRSRFGRREFKLSLQTRDLLHAREHCRKLSTHFEKVVSTVANNQDLTKADIDRMVRSYFEGLVQEANELRYMSRIPGSGVDITDEADYARNKINSLRQEIISEPSGRTKGAAQKLWEENSPAPVRVFTEEFYSLCDGVLRAEIEAARILAALLEGRLEDTKCSDNLFDGIDTSQMPPLADYGRDNTIIPNKRSLSALVEVYSNQMKIAGRWAESADQENTRALSWFASEFGSDKAVENFTLDDVRAFRDLLAQLPPNFSILKKYSGMKLSEIASGYDGHPLAPKTQVKMFTAVKAFFQWCVNEGYLTKSPVGELAALPKPSKKRTRRAFSNHELKKLFLSPLYTGCAAPKRRSVSGDNIYRDGMYWLPLVGLFTGMRLGELIQLPVKHVKEQDGVLYFDLSGIKLKTDNSMRQIPVHPELLKLGFMGFVRAQEKNRDPDARLFEDFTLGSTKDPGGPASKVIMRYIRSAVTKDKMVVFHSFRHSFSDALRQTDIQDSRRRKLMGHAGEGATDTDYDSVLEAVHLTEDMAKVSYPIDLSHLYVPDSSD